MHIIGLTGGIATGKTTATNYLAKHFNTPIIDADLINKQLIEPNNEGYVNILKIFPKTRLLSDHSIDKKTLKNLIFSQPNIKLKLERILHPLIEKQIVIQIQQNKKANAPFCIVSAAVLIEANFLCLVDKLWVTDCTQDIQIKRLIQRDEISETKAINIISQQLNQSDRLKLADLIIPTSTFKSMEKSLNNAHYQYSS